jgi:hypothetical protein
MLSPQFASAEGATRLGMVGKIYVSSLTGTVECVTQEHLLDLKDGGPVGSEGRIIQLKKGSVFVGNGSVISTGKNSSVTLVFSNKTAMYLDENTQLEIKRFEQEPFTPNNNLLIEPSNSATLAVVKIGRVVIDTPQLLSGTSLAFETRHSNIAVLNVETGGEKAFIEVTEKQTHVAMIAGEANVIPLGGHVVTRLTGGQQAFVKYTLGSKIDQEPAAAARIEASVLRISGSPMVRLAGAGADAPLLAGAKLPEGSVVITAAESEVYLQPFNGAVADIKPNSEVEITRLEVAANPDGVVTKQTALLDLRSGTVVSVIDPAKRAIDDYAIGTPKGMVHAHGTSFAVSIDSRNVSIVETADSVTLVSPSGVTYSISQGYAVVVPADGQPQPPVPLAQAVASYPALAGILNSAVATMLDVVRNNIGGLPAGAADALLEQVIAVASAALPAEAATFARDAARAIDESASTTYIVVNRFDNGKFGDIRRDLDETDAAGSSVTFTDDNNSNGRPTVQAAPNAPTSPIANDVVSPANQ